MQDGDSIAEVAIDWTTGELVWSGSDQHGNLLQIVEIPHQDGVTLVERSVTFGSNEAIVRTTWTDFDENNNPVGEPQREVAFPNAIITGEDIGSIFGSSLGQAFGGNNVFSQIAAGTALSTLLGNVGETLHHYFNDTQSLPNPNSPSLTLSQAADAAFVDIDVDLANAFRAQSIFAVSSFLTGELAESLGFDGTSFGNQLLRATTGSLLTTALSNAAQIALGSNTSVFNLIQGNPLIGIGTFLGTYLAREIIEPQNLGGSIGGSLRCWRDLDKRQCQAMADNLQRRREPRHHHVQQRSVDSCQRLRVPLNGR